MNALTKNWTIMPPDLEAARQQWEYSHAANAVLTFAALALIAVGALASQRAGVAGLRLAPASESDPRQV
jgi:hypothetical protein